jgi:hypothetical protein
MNQSKKNRESTIPGARPQAATTLIVGLLLLLFFAVPGGAQAATVTWDGDAGDGLWFTRENWDGDTLPQEGDTITIAGDVGEVVLNEDFTLFGRLIVNGTSSIGATLRIASGVTLTLDSTLLSASSESVSANLGALIINDGVIQGQGAPTFDLDSLFGLGTTFTNNNLVNNVSFRIGSTNSTLRDSTLNNNGTMNAVAISPLGGTINNSGLIDGRLNLQFANFNNEVGGTINIATAIQSRFINDTVFNNHGTLTNPGTITNQSVFNNFGTVDNTGGTFVNDGTFNAECGSVLIGVLMGNPAVVFPCDVTPPVITVPAGITAEATSEFGALVPYTPMPSATDDTDGAITPTCAPLSGTSFPLGPTTVTCTATDAAGNTALASFTVNVVDTTPPVLTVPGDFTAEANDVLSALDIGMATATDFFEPVTIANNAPPDGFPLGPTTVTWTATDANGNVATATQHVTVVDTTPPILTVPPNMTFEANAMSSTVNIGMATAMDIFAVTVTNNAPAGFPLGTTVVTWVATDASGNSATGVQQVTVEDTTPPVLTPPPPVTVEASDVLSMVDIGTATATDIFPVTVASDAPDTFPLGPTTVTWTATDTSGNVTTATQQVTVVDTTPPVLNVPGDVTVTATGPLTMVAIGTATATDIFEPVTISNDAPAAGFPVGTHEVTWTATDANGNVASAGQQIHVIYQFGGFLTPVVQGGVYKAGRTLPVKIRAFLADGTLVPDLNATLTVQMLSNGVPSGDPIEIGSSSTADTGTMFRLSDDLYIFNLSTKSLSPGTYALIVDLHDGSDPRLIVIALK